MNFLDEKLAEEIVDRTMQIIDYNINVMNENGIIISSGDRDRIGTVHNGAEKVINEGSGFEISKERAAQLNGVKAGINLPIYLNTQLVGVVGITGTPEDIRNYSELVKMTAELIVKQASLLNDIQWDERLKEELMSQLLNGVEKLDDYYFERLNRLGIDLNIPRVAIVQTFDNHAKGYKCVRDKLDKDDLYIIKPDYMVVLKKIDIKTGVWIENNTIERVKNWQIDLKKHRHIHSVMAIGDYYPNLSGLQKSFQTAHYTLKTGEKLHPFQSVYFYKDYKLPVFIARANDLGMDDEVGPYFKQLQYHDKKGDLVDTILTYVEENGDIGLTAKRLFIHRNTLGYRLERIKEMTGADPRKVKELLMLYLSILQNQIN